MTDRILSEASGDAAGVTVMDRRAFVLAGTGLGLTALLGCGQRSGGGDSGSTPKLIVEKLPAPSQAYSIVKRTSFGVTRDALAEVEAHGVQAYLERQLDFESIPDAVVAQAVSQRFPTLTLPTAVAMKDFPANLTTLANDLSRASLFRAFFSRRELFEVMVEFWSNHFSIHLGNGFEPVFKPADDRDIIRPMAMGKFRQMLLASARSPAMLFSLDNYLNTRAAPNENFARELMELHTLGVDGGYTERDVKEVARCFTGWSVNFSTGDFLYQAAIHDDGPKLVLGQAIAAGGQEQDGIAVLNLLAGAEATSRHIASKLCRRFIADTPPADVVAQVAKTFRDSDGDIRAMLRTIFASPAFLDARDSKFDRPVEFVGQILRALNPQLRIPADGGEPFFSMVQLLGQLPFFWVPPDGYPDTARYWVSTSGFLNRWRVATFAVQAGGFDFAALIGSAYSVSTVVDALAGAVLQRPLRADDRQTLIHWLAGLAGGMPDVALPPSALNMIAPLATAMLISSVYFQLR